MMKITLTLQPKAAKVQKPAKKPYDERTDLEKIRDNWKKISGLMNRKEWSSAIVRAATATEIAANVVVREELQKGYGLPAELVDHFLKWANGIQGKFDKLILPSTKGKGHSTKLKKLKTRVEEINRERNSVVHSGAFKSESDARKVVDEAKSVIVDLVGLYDESFQLS